MTTTRLRHKMLRFASRGQDLDPEDFAAPPLDEDKVLVPAGAEINEPQRPWPVHEDDPAQDAFDPDAWRFDKSLSEDDLAVFFYVPVTAEADLVQDIFAPAAQHYLRRRAKKLPENVD